MQGERCLKKGDKIKLYGKSDENTYIFYIDDVISDNGASAISYRAHYASGSKGILKEFYPIEADYLVRNEDNQLRLSEDYLDTNAQKILQSEMEEYIHPQVDLRRQMSESDEKLSDFIPEFEIYSGEYREGTAYIWTPGAEVETFKDICDEIHKNPEREPEHMLATALLAVKSLTECICELHRLGFVHRDIKPSNFGFKKRNRKTLTQSISIFDINSVCSVYGENDEIVGSPDYIPPEIFYCGERPTNKTDIYAIGVTLFHAIVIADENDDSRVRYSRELLKDLPALVGGSKLIQASVVNSYPELVNTLVEILQKCLCEKRRRYDSCEELLEDLEKAIAYILPSDITKNTSIDTDLMNKYIEKKKNEFLAIQYHLYQHPLYKYASNDEMNVFIFGFGNYGQKFLDACLQNGQMMNKTLNVHVVLNENASFNHRGDDHRESDADDYLKARPELKNFFHIYFKEGGMHGTCEESESYGNIIFESKENFYAAEKPLHYVFVALGSDEKNFEIAKQCQETADKLGVRSTISYIRESGVASKTKGTDATLCPLYINADIKESPVHAEIERMAFNTHLIWEKNFNVDYRDVRKEFLKKYNHDASVSSVVSMKYKLYCMGIDLDETDFCTAAKQFSARFHDEEEKLLKNELIWMEHRRWVTEKICLGWRKKNVLDCAKDYLTKDEKNKKHVCIVKSRPDQKLLEEYKDLDKWDRVSEKELGALDELDRLSVDLHRLFAEKAKRVRKEDLIHHLTEIRSLCEGSKEATIAFGEWLCCIKNILQNHKDKDKVRPYKGLRSAFLKVVDGLPDEKRKVIKTQVKAFETIFQPVLMSQEYRDWKFDDVAIIENIPFILTYTEKAYMVIPFATGDHDAVFGNVASATVVSPERMIYLYLADTKDSISNLKETIPGVFEYMNRKHFKAKEDFVLAYTEKGYDAYREAFLCDEIRGLGEGRIGTVKLIKLEKSEDAPEKFEEYLKGRNKGKEFFALEKNDTALSNRMKDAKVYDSFQSYEFDSKTIRFTETNNCDMLQYIHKKPYISVADMMALKRSLGVSSNQPEFYDDYEDLWQQYKDNTVSWKSLCNKLREYAEEEDVLASFEKKSEKGQEASIYQYILPIGCSRAARKIVDYLKDAEILETESKVYGYSSDSCKIEIVDKHINKHIYEDLYNRLFSCVYELMSPDEILLNQGADNKVYVICNRLQVEEIGIGDNLEFNFDFTEEEKLLLNYFHDKGFVNIAHNEKRNIMSITFGSKQIKELLTSEDKMLEIYTYHKAKACGKFDDVVSGNEINLENSNGENEFDCILTKGFQSIFVKCKAQNSMDQDYYQKLKALADQIGVNATVVFASDPSDIDHIGNA